MKYAVEMGLRCHDIHANFHIDLFSHSKVDTQTAWRSRKSSFIISN
jgi:hypothetical protein